MNPSFVILLLVLPLTRPQQSLYEPSETEKAVAGCYQIQMGEWKGNPGSPVPLYRLPDVVELTLESADSRGLKFGPDIPEFTALEPSEPFCPRWSISGPDTLRLAWSTGHRGVIITARAARNDSIWVGTAQSFQDLLLGERQPDGTLRPYGQSWAYVVLVRVESQKDRYLTRR